jgi:hypothetical protein
MVPLVSIRSLLTQEKQSCLVLTQKPRVSTGVQEAEVAGLCTVLARTISRMPRPHAPSP